MEDKKFLEDVERKINTCKNLLNQQSEAHKQMKLIGMIEAFEYCRDIKTPRKVPRMELYLAIGAVIFGYLLSTFIHLWLK